MGNYDIHSDLENNRLYVTLRGFYRDIEVKEISDKVISEVKKLKPGFAVINDISKLKPTTEFGAGQLARVYLIFKAFGLGRVIRITGSNIATRQFEQASKAAGHSAEIASSIEEAEKMLNNVKKHSTT